MKHYTKTDKEKGIAHYKRMIEWAKTRNQYLEKPNLRLMYNKLGESYSSNDCVLCKKFLDHPRCLNCPFHGTKNDCRKEGSLHDKMAKAGCWMEWIEYAEEMVKTLGKIKVYRQKIKK